MWILPLVGYLGLVLGFAFLVLAIASGLYYLSELVEEHTVIAKKSISRLIWAIVAIQSLLWLVDGYPTLPSLLSIASHVLYLQNLRRFPIVKLSDPVFISSCVLVLVNHYLWFRHFSQPPPYSPSSSSHPYRRYAAGESPYEPYPSFSEIASFFGLCVWLVPFALFVSLSASENVLPSMGSEYATGEGSSFARAGKEPVMRGRGNSLGSSKGGRQGMAKAAVESAPKTTTQPVKLASIISYFHTSRVAHSVKDLEKALPSVASINGMQVKDYLQALQDDGKIRVEKIGSGNWYWAFAGEDKRNKQQMVDKATEERDRVKVSVDDVQQRLSDASAARGEQGEGDRDEAMEQHVQLAKNIEALKAELAGHAENDPVEAERRRQEVDTTKTRTEIYTDQISEMERYMLDELQMDREAIGQLKVEYYGVEYDADDETLRDLQEP